VSFMVGVLPSPDDLMLDLGRCALRRAMGRARAICQSGYPMLIESLDPFSHNSSAELAPKPVGRCPKNERSR